jgi:hypothetical protein
MIALRGNSFKLKRYRSKVSSDGPAAVQFKIQCAGALNNQKLSANR